MKLSTSNEPSCLKEKQGIVFVRPQNSGRNYGCQSRGPGVVFFQT